jgi:hypothetical protein
MESHRWKWVQITSIPSYFIYRTEKFWSLPSILIIIRNVTAWGGLGVPMNLTPEQRQSLQGLTPKKEHGRFLHVIIVLIAAWTVASTFAVALQCNLSHPWILIQKTSRGAVTAYTSRPSGELTANPHAVPAMAGYFRLRYLL